ncbi:MAG TPA: hypothetical protein VG675_11030 [Bryobacteraceae bacterium]|nr:hypothetical protein [Bryobacteraceae bacterium]
MTNRPCRANAASGWIAAFAALLVPLGASAADAHAMGTVPCSWSVPIQLPDHTLDVAATIRLLRANGFTCYVQPIEEKPPMSFDDFTHLLPAAQAAGIEIWPVLIPHHEGASLPYRYDFVLWMRELAKLSLKYTVLRGVNIDDTDVGGNENFFTHEYLTAIYQAKQKINPSLLFVPTIYDLDPAEADRLQGCVDGVWLWWVNLEQNNGLRAFLTDSRIVARRRFPVYGGVYAHSTSWHKQGGPKPTLLEKALQLACTHSDGAVIWQLPLTEESNPWLDVARRFVAGGASPLAGKCGISPQ